MTTIPDIKLDDHLCFKLYVASRMVMRAYGPELAPLNLTYPKYVVLVALGEDNDQSVGQLAERLSLDLGTLSPLLKSLVASGYLERRRDAKDDRTVHNHLTPAGRVALKKAQKIAYGLYCELGVVGEEFLELRGRLSNYIAHGENLAPIHKLNTRSTSKSTVKKRKMS